MIFAKRMESLSSAIFKRLDEEKNELLAQGREVFNFSIGTPDLRPAQHIIDALTEAAKDPDNYKYAVTDLPELTETVIEWYRNRYGVELESDMVLALSGSQDGLSHIALTLADPGDIVLAPDPGYPIFSVGPGLACAEVVRMPLLKENGFIIDLKAIPEDVARRARLMIVSYPSNPVAAIAPDAFYHELIEYAAKHEITILHDNAYSELVFDHKGGSFLSYPGASEVGVEFNSLSKSYNMSGCRIAFALGNRELIRQLKVLKSHLDYGVFLPVQRAAITALRGPQDCVESISATYRSRMELLVDGLNEIGWRMDRTPGTMFVWAPIPNGFASADDFTFQLLEKTGVIVVPGSSFGSNGEGFVRFALVQPEEKIRQALEVIRSSGIISGI